MLKLEIGCWYDWAHGDNIRVAKLIDIQPEFVVILGDNGEYEMKIETFKRKINEPDRFKSKAGV